jgi:predicted dehydrogenase
MHRGRLSDAWLAKTHVSLTGTMPRSRGTDIGTADSQMDLSGEKIGDLHPSLRHERRFRPSTDPRNVAVIGLGYWGPNLLRVLTERTDVEVRWMCDLDRSRLDHLIRRYPGVRPTVDLADVLEDPEVDGVVIATPVHSHYHLAMRALKAGKHVLVEKPLASSTVAALEMVDYASEHDLQLMCGHTFLYSPPVRMVKALIDEGELGDLYFVSSSRVNLGLHQRDVSVIWDLGPHDFSILLYWLGDRPSAIRATGRDSIVAGIADVAFVNMEFPSGVVANVELSWLAPSKLRRTVVVGSKKMVVYEDGIAEPIRIFDRGVVYEDPATFGQYHLSYRTGDILSPKLSSDEPLSVQLGDFVTAMRTGQPPEHGSALALDVVRLIEAADASLARGGDRVDVDDLSFANLNH